MTVRRHLFGLGLVIAMAGLVWAMWLMSGQATSVSGAPGARADYRYRTDTAALTLVAGTIGAMIASRFAKKDT